MAGEDTLAKIVVFLACINIFLVLGGFGVSTNTVDLTDNSTIGNQNVYSSIGTALMLVNLVLGGGIVGLLVSAGLPIEVQWIIGVPMLILTIFAVLPLIGRLIGGITSILKGIL